MVPGMAMVFSSRQGHRLQFQAGTWSSVPGRVIVFSSRQGHRLQHGLQFLAGPWSSTLHNKLCSVKWHKMTCDHCVANLFTYHAAAQNNLTFHTLTCPQHKNTTRGLKKNISTVLSLLCIHLFRRCFPWLYLPYFLLCLRSDAVITDTLIVLVIKAERRLSIGLYILPLNFFYNAPT